jgi:hypothetical protein
VIAASRLSAGRWKETVITIVIVALLSSFGCQ